MKTSDLTDTALDWAVHVALHGSCEGYPEHGYSTDWAHGGPIVEREHIGTDWRGFGVWEAWDDKTMPAPRYTGPTPLIAAMRCFCCSKWGDEVEIPENI